MTTGITTTTPPDDLTNRTTTLAPVVNPTTVTSDTIETLNQRVSVRDYTDEPVDDETVRAILNAARRSATSSNVQSYSFVVVRDPETKRQLAHLAGNQKHIETCPVFVAVCADISRLMQASEMHNQTFAINLETSMVAIVDAALVGQSASLAAESLGLGTVMIGGMRNHPSEVIELLGLPKGVFVLFGLCLGWPALKTPQKPRLQEEAIIHYERYTPITNETLIEHDAQLAQNYRDQGRNTPDAAWTGVIAQKFNRKNREHLRGVLEDQGYNFD